VTFATRARQAEALSRTLPESSQSEAVAPAAAATLGLTCHVVPVEVNWLIEHLNGQTKRSDPALCDAWLRDGDTHVYTWRVLK
jgi:hypothetical protein